ncbi:hypothetical protein [Paludibacterium denitrificans]|uniref:hypothetical protein n=1 Tax=Paludibacterium denitrificans TaxID=2675226 RepID=UPI001E35AD96|nr:hypothetical protein [Paludibacterium denitrificans]
MAENPFQCPLIPLEQLEQRYLRWAFLQYPQDRAARRGNWAFPNARCTANWASRYRCNPLKRFGQP